MRYRTLIALSLAGLIIAGSSAALDIVKRKHGSACVGRTAADSARLAYNNYGVRNTSTTSSARVVCSTDGFERTTGQQTLLISGWLDDPSTTATCTFYQTDSSGDPYWSRTLTGESGQWGRFSLLFKTYDEKVSFGFFDCSLPKANADGRAGYVSGYQTEESE